MKISPATSNTAIGRATREWQLILISDHLRIIGIISSYLSL